MPRSEAGGVTGRRQVGPTVPEASRPSSSIRGRVSVAFGCLLLCGCGFLGPDEERVVGQIDLSDLQSSILIPDFASGRSFRATIYSVGDGCTRSSQTAVTISGAEVGITPFDIVNHAETCLDIMTFHEHTADLPLHESGVTRISIHARSLATGEAVVIHDSVLAR